MASKFGLRLQFFEHGKIPKEVGYLSNKAVVLQITASEYRCQILHLYMQLLYASVDEMLS